MYKYVLFNIFTYICATFSRHSEFFTFKENPCSYCADHIACSNSWLYSDKCYSSAHIIEMTPDIKEFILRKHNEHRNILSGGLVPGYATALRMASIGWNVDYQFLAALNLLQCEMAHDKCRRTPTNPYVGQNLAYLKWRGYDFTTKEIIDQLIGYWFEEYKYAQMEDIRMLPERPQNLPLIGHFTMMAQERANKVGCAILRQVSADNVNELYFACDYSFSNIYTVEVYRTGPIARGCMSGVNDNYTNLCSLNEQYDTNLYTTFYRSIQFWTLGQHTLGLLGWIHTELNGRAQQAQHIRR